MNIKLAILFLAFIFVFANQALCDESSQARLLFYKGNSHYNEEKFEEAIANYEEAVNLGFESGPLYYNLGNAYFKYGSLGKAILNYLRARRLMPEDADLKSNLNYARSLVKGGPVAPGRGWFTRIFFVLADSFSLDTFTLLGTILYFILAVLIIFAVTVRKLRKIFIYIIAPLSVILIVCIFVFFVQFYKMFFQKEAVVIRERSDCKFEPLVGATTFFTLNEGASVVVIGSEKDWVKVRRSDGKQGWIEKSDIESL